MNDRAAPATCRPLAWRPGLSMRELVALVRPLQVHPATLREVEAVEYVLDRVATGSQLGGLEQHDGTIWMVCGIFEPVDPHAPWAIAYVARRGPDPVLRTPSVLVDQDLVTRVHDGID